MSKLVVPFLLLAACATGEVTNEPGTTPQMRARSAVPTDTARIFPEVAHPRLPTAERFASQIRAEAGDVASADVKVCLTPGGQVQNIMLVSASSSRTFDQAVLSDVAGWQFGEIPGPSELRACETATITYRTHP